jgi:hypothetical protein
MPTYPYPEKVTNALIEIGLKSEDCLWDCHGTWVLKHYACERLAAHNGITWNDPELIENDSDAGKVVIKLWGHLNDKSEFTFGEATPKNSKNAYPYAMAEKRAKDRIILKLIGFHGEIYSEDEAEDFEEEVKAQEKAEKKEEQERVDTSVYGKIGKKKATQEIKKLTPLFAKSKSDDKKTRDQALKDAKEINLWAKKHNLAIVQESYYKLFERKKSA